MSDQTAFSFTRRDFDRFILEVGAYLVMADGEPGSEELRELKREFSIDPHRLPEAATVYNGQLHHPRSLMQIYRSAALGLETNPEAGIGILAGMCRVAAVDGGINEAERRVLEELARLLQIDGAIKDRVFETHGLKSSRASSEVPGQGSQERASHLARLGLLSNATPEEIEEEYKRLVRRYHPDRLRSVNLSDAERLAAERRLVELNLSYRWLKDHQN